MGSDRARITYDPTRKWRGLVAQQGRVTVEADWNEAAAIDAADERAVTLDVVGPVGAPHGGYAVTATPPASPPGSASPPSSAEGDLTVGTGTLYLGGERLDLGAPVDLADQPDWRDPATGTLWVAPTATPASPPTATGTELVYLLAIEQEVSALEDPALTDVALGGPDTMQRLRVLQRFVRWPTQASSCTQAFSEVQAAWATDGLTLDQATMRLESTAKLEVGFVTDPAPASPCQPVATGGYLGAENQLIRVQITDVDADGVPTIVWGFDDATFLYGLRSAAPDSTGGLILTLAKAPVDSYHNPVAGQAVELLRDAAGLTPDQPGSATNGYIAAAAGQVFTLTQGYDSSSRTVVVTGSLPAGYQDAHQLYLRVWQGSTPAPAGTPVTLTGAGATTGVTVTLSATGGIFHPGDFWCFALRPSVPDLIYPDRYGVAPQPPEGARVHACPIALVTWPAQGNPSVTSCIPPFDNLVELTARGGGCCTVRVTPDALSAASLKTLLAPYIGRGPIAVCFAPGVYTLSEPLILDKSFNNITLEGCGGPVTLQAPDKPGSQFLLGLIVLEGPGGVTIRGIDLVAPLVSFTPGDAFTVLSRTAGQGNQVLLEQFAVDLMVAVGICAQNTAGLVLEDCRFTLDFTQLRVAANIFAAGILASGALSETAIRSCAFATSPIPTTVPFYDLATADPTTDNRPMPPYRLTFGYLQVPTWTQSSSLTAGPFINMGVLHDAAIEGCRFLGVTVPALAISHLGTVRLESNTVQDCYGGFWLMTLGDASQAAAFELVPAGDAATNGELAAVGLSVLGNGILVLALAMARVLPTTPPTGDKVTSQVIAPLDQATLSVAAQGLRNLLAQALGNLTAAAATTSTTASTPATGLLGRLIADAHNMFTRQQPTVAPAPTPGSAPAQGPAGAAATVPVEITAETSGPEPAAGTLGSLPQAPRADLVSTLLPALNRILTNVGAQLAQVPTATDTGTGPVLRLALSGNQIDAVVANSYSGPGLLVMDTTATFGSVLLTGNRITNRFPGGQAAVIYTAEDAAAINGNIIVNEGARNQ
jgi:hypothetical protein